MIERAGRLLGALLGPIAAPRKTGGWVAAGKGGQGKEAKAEVLLVPEPRAELVHRPPRRHPGPPAECHTPHLHAFFFPRTRWALDLGGLRGVQQVSFASLSPVGLLCKEQW